MSAGGAATGGGNTGADQGFFNTEKAKKDKTRNTGADQGFFNSEKQKVNDSLIGNSDYQGDVNPNAQKNKTKNTTYNNNGGDGGGGDGNNTITQVTKTAPTEAEVSQAATAKADEETEANRLLKIKKRGRSQSIISGSQGVTKMASNYSLGKKSLLGRV